MDPKHVGRISGSLFDGDFPHEEFGTAPQTQPVVENIERAKTVPGIGGLWGSQSLRAWRGLHIAWAQKTGDGEYDACKVLAAMAMRGKMARATSDPMHLFTPEGRTAAAEVWQVGNDLAEFDNLYGVLPPAMAMILRMMLMAYVDEKNQFPAWTGRDVDEETYHLANVMIAAFTEWVANVQSNPEQKGVVDLLGPRTADQIEIFMRTRDDTEGKQRVWAWTNLKSTVSDVEETWLEHMNGPSRDAWRFVKMPKTVLWQRDRPLQDYGVQDKDVLVAYMVKDIKELLQAAVEKEMEEEAHQRSMEE